LPTLHDPADDSDPPPTKQIELVEAKVFAALRGPGDQDLK
jgi:hypothetical protein